MVKLIYLEVKGLTEAYLFIFNKKWKLLLMKEKNQLGQAVHRKNNTQQQQQQQQKEKYKQI